MSGSGGSIFEVLQNILEAIGFGNAGDVLTSRGASKFPTFQVASGGTTTQRSAVTPLAGASVDINLPAAPFIIQIIEIIMWNVIPAAATSIGIQLGTAAGFEVAGYLGTTGFMVPATGVQGYSDRFIWENQGSGTIHGIGRILLGDPATGTWIWSTSPGRSNIAGAFTGGGLKALAAPLTRLRITASPSTFTSGFAVISFSS